MPDDDNITGSAGDVTDAGEITEFAEDYAFITRGLERPPDMGPPRTRLGGNIQIDDLCLVIGDLIKFLEKKQITLPDGTVTPVIPPDWRVFYTPAYPDELLENTGGIQHPDSPQEKVTNIVCYKIVKYMNASIDPQPFEGRRPARKRSRGNHPTSVDGEYYGIWSKWMDALIQFDCFAKTNIEAIDLIRNLEETLEYYERVFLGLGVQKWLYWDRVTDASAESLAKNNKMNVRSFQMYARIEKFFVVPTRAIEEIITEFEVRVGRPPTDWNNS